MLKRFDAELRIDPVPEAGTRFEAIGGVVRATGKSAGIVYWELSEADADRTIEEQVAYFRSLGQEVEWKVYGHDRPRDLGARLAAHGFEPRAPETLMVCDLAGGVQSAPPNLDIEIRCVRDDAGLHDLVAVASDAFGRDFRARFDRFRLRLGDPTLGLFVAYAGGVPVAGGRLEMPPGRSFAGLWGGGTVPTFRGRGIYRTLVAARAREAARQGFRYLTVDAGSASRPILERLGFVPLSTITEWVRQPGAGVVPR
ncbi:MAG TPA: GNAT family N-acetyltransferase [Gemmatimonadales bacterium]|nr:GNAT family N-acetyltransferase [Gemmatimonadales bacterium]